MKFIQITSARLENNQQTQANWILHALDSDGRIWELDDMHGWREVPLPTPAPTQETRARTDACCCGPTCKLKFGIDLDADEHCSIQGPTEKTRPEHCTHGIPIDSPSACPSCHSTANRGGSL